MSPRKGCSRSEPVPERLYEGMSGQLFGWLLPDLSLDSRLPLQRRVRGQQQRRGPLLLPGDLLQEGPPTCHVRVEAPKTQRRGTGRVQHFVVKEASFVGFLEALLLDRPLGERIFGASAATFRRRWDNILRVLEVPGNLKLAHPRRLARRRSCTPVPAECADSRPALAHEASLSGNAGELLAGGCGRECAPFFACLSPPAHFCCGVALQYPASALPCLAVFKRWMAQPAGAFLLRLRSAVSSFSTAVPSSLQAVGWLSPPGHFCCGFALQYPASALPCLAVFKRWMASPTCRFSLLGLLVWGGRAGFNVCFHGCLPGTATASAFLRLSMATAWTVGPSFREPHRFVPGMEKRGTAPSEPS